MKAKEERKGVETTENEQWTKVEGIRKQKCL